MDSVRRLGRQCLSKPIERNTRAAGGPNPKLFFITGDQLRRHLSFNAVHEFLRACNIHRNRKHATHNATEECSYPLGTVLTPDQDSIALFDSVIHQLCGKPSRKDSQFAVACSTLAYSLPGDDSDLLPMMREVVHQ
jgi:hypothetical protein